MKQHPFIKSVAFTPTGKTADDLAEIRACNTAKELTNKAYNEGWGAYANDRPCEANPYRASTNLEQNDAWRRGWAECPPFGARGGL